MQAVRIASTADMPRDEWLSIRRRGIGGSDIAAIAGLNPWRSPMQVYLEKIRAIPEEPENEAMYWGKVLEQVVADEFARRNGLKVQRVNAVLQHPKYPIFLANIDRLVKDKPKGDAVLEIKTTSSYGAKEWEDEKEPGKVKVPDWAMVQLQWYLSITGLKRGFLAALIGGQKYVQAEVERDDEAIGYLHQIALDFWKLVENRTPPEMDGSEAAREVVNLLYPVAQESRIVDLPPEALELIAEYETAKEEEKAAAERKEAAANKLKLLLGEAEKGRIGDRLVVWRNISPVRLDTKSLKEEMPEIYQKYAKPSPYRKFEVK
jgi:putative phage-type endonuclease